MPIDSSGSICTATVRLIPVAYSKPLGLSPVPDVRNVTRQPPRNNEDGIDPDVVPVAGIARRKSLGCNGDATKAIFVQRPGRCLLTAALLNLNERDRPAATGDEIYFAARNAGAPGKDAPTLKAQPPRGNCFGVSPACLS